MKELPPDDLATLERTAVILERLVRVPDHRQRSAVLGLNRLATQSLITAGASITTRTRREWPGRHI